MQEAPGTSFDDEAGAPVPTTLVATIIVMAYASFFAYLLNSFAIKHFLAELTRLIDKFLW